MVFNFNLKAYPVLQSQIITTQSFKLMYGHRQNIDLESMIDKNSALSRPRPPTPIRKVPVRVPGNKENMINPGNQWGVAPLKINTNFQDKELIMPDNVKKPLISPVRNPFKAQIESLYEEEKRGVRGVPKQRQSITAPTCANHPSKPAEFNIDIQDQCFAYCSRCAAQLASQGFQVRKIEAQQTIKKGDRLAQPQNTPQLPIYPQYQGNPLYEQILQFLTQLSETENEHLHNMTKLSTIESSYSQQITLTTHFYTQLLSFISQMRDDHINDLVQESRRHSQIGDIEHDYLRENVEEMGGIRRDIEENLETIVEKLDQEDLRNNLNYYKQKLQVYRHKVQEQADFFGKLIDFTPEQYQSKLGRVEDFLMEVWVSDAEGEEDREREEGVDRFVQKFMPTQPQQQPRTQPIPQRETQNTFKPSAYTYQPQPQPQFQPQQPRTQPQQPQQPLFQAPTLPKKPSGMTQQQQQQQNETKSTAFRKLFEEDEDQVMAETSPQFKKI